MNYEQSIEYIHSLLKFGIRPGMERITALCRAFGNPQKDLKFVHVAGTNGKGSTSTMISNIFTSAGYKTGLFISPYVVDFCERMQIDGEMISHDELAETVTEMKAVAEKMSESPTEFEFITAASFLWFKRKKCDVVVLEVGLGGRLDSTNVIDAPLASVIVSVSLDHTAVLGDTVEKIAYEKCGIIKENGITVSYPCQLPEVHAVIKRISAERNNTLIVPEVSEISVLNESMSGTGTVIDGIAVRIPFMGRHMVMNASVAVYTARTINSRTDFNLSDESIKNGIEASVMPARMEILTEKPLVIIDGGHNEGCAQALRSAIEKHLSKCKITAICGMMADKDYMKYLEIVAPLFEKLIAVTPTNPRSLAASELKASAEAYCKSSVADSFEEAVRLAYESAGEDGVILVCGSFYLASDIRNTLLGQINC